MDISLANKTPLSIPILFCRCFMADVMQIKVTCDNSKVGELFILDGRLLRGAKRIRENLGKRVARVIILQVFWQYVKQEQDFGSFEFNCKRFAFSSTTAEQQLKADDKRDF